MVIPGIRTLPALKKGPRTWMESLGSMIDFQILACSEKGTKHISYFSMYTQVAMEGPQGAFTIRLMSRKA